MVAQAVLLADAILFYFGSTVPMQYRYLEIKCSVGSHESCPIASLQQQCTMVAFCTYPTSCCNCTCRDVLLGPKGFVSKCGSASDSIGDKYFTPCWPSSAAGVAVVLQESSLVSRNKYLRMNILPPCTLHEAVINALVTSSST